MEAKRLQVSLNESGTGLVGTAFGACAFLAFMFLATHTLISLYASSVLSNVAWDTAQSVAHNLPADPSIATVEQQRAASKLHGYSHAVVEISATDDVATVHITSDRPMFLPAALARSTHLGRLDTTANARIENWR